MQYFIGDKKYRREKPFDPSLLVTFRKRLPEKTMNRIIERSFLEAIEEDQYSKKDKNKHSFSGSTVGTGADSKEPPNKGTLIIDATCAPADIAIQQTWNYVIRPGDGQW